uniref:Proline rich 7 (synaptic) n=1 Tax=Oreochromis niloticus TaxID=8128 RepID=A0A669E444_ORENI
MVMSQGTYTFLACFAGFWLVWALVVMLCCFCREAEEQCLRTVEMEPLSCHPAGYPPAAPPAPPPPPPQQPPQLPRDPPQFSPPQTLSPPLPLPVPHPLPQATWVSMPVYSLSVHNANSHFLVLADTDVFGKPPCYEEAVLMDDPPPPYCEVLADPEPHDRAPVFTSETSKPPAATVFPNRGYSSLIRLPSSQRWDSLGHLLSNMDLNHNNLTPPATRSLQATAAMATMPRREPRTHNDGLRGGIQGLQGGIQGFQGGLQGLQGGPWTQGGWSPAVACQQPSPCWAGALLFRPKFCQKDKQLKSWTFGIITLLQVEI